MGTKPVHTEEELAQLTEEEREGLMDPETDEPDDDGEGDEDTVTGAEVVEPEKAATEAVAETEAEKGDEEKPEGKETAEKGEAATGEEKIEAEATGAVDAAASVDDTVTEAAAVEEVDGDDDDAISLNDLYRPRPVPQWVMPENAEQRLADIDKRLGEYEAKFDDGDIDRAEYSAAQKSLSAEKTELTGQVDRARMAWDMAMTEWKDGVVPSLLEKRPEYAPGSPLHAALDQAVRQVQVSGKYSSPLDPQILIDADKMVRASIRKATGGKVVKAPAAAPVESKTKTAKTAKDLPKRDALPPSLAKVPAAEASEIEDGGEYAYLDRLKGVAFEDALAKLPDAKRDEYLAR